MTLFTWILPLLAGCVNHWQEGTWVEEDFQVRGEGCDWASLIVSPDTPFTYNLGERSDDDTSEGELENDTLAATEEWMQSRANNFWSYCGYDEPGLSFSCAAAVQLVQPELGLQSYFNKLCSSPDEVFVSGNSWGLLVRGGEAFMNHNLEIYCDDWMQDGTDTADADTGGTSNGESQSCALTYSSWLKKQ